MSLCGQHTSDPFSLRFFNRIGVDIVCAPPTKIAVAKVAAAQAEIEQSSVYRGKYHKWPFRGTLYSILSFFVLFTLCPPAGEMSLNDNIYRRLLTGEVIL